MAGLAEFVADAILNPGPTNTVVNVTTTLVDTTLKTAVTQVVETAISITLENVIIDILSNGDVVIVVDQESSTTASLTAQLAVEMLLDLVKNLNQKAELSQESFFGFQFTGNAISNENQDIIRTTIKNSMSQFINTNDVKLIRDLAISVDNSNPLGGAYTMSPTTTIPPSGDVSITITQNSSINVSLAASSAILAELGIAVDLSQEGELEVSADPVSNAIGALADLLNGAAGTLLIIGIFLIILVLLSKPAAPAAMMPPRGGYYQDTVKPVPRNRPTAPRELSSSEADKVSRIVN